MPITHSQMANAVVKQRAAADDPRTRVRLVAGPGTGKSRVIEERVAGLLHSGVGPESVCAVSFTRASALDLSIRVHRHCAARGLTGSERVRVSTLHSLSLRLLAAAGVLRDRFPATPLVLDQWELESVFDTEFALRIRNTRLRAEEVRRYHEAFWSSGRWSPEEYDPPEPTISPEEQAEFRGFHRRITHLYSCVLPGELVQRCVELFDAGSIDVNSLIGLQHLIVDEYQDLNPVDLRFVDAVADQGVSVFVAGDDDQSLYSFRYASPAGLREFTEKYPDCGQHALEDCFRCTPEVVAAATSVIIANALPKRIPKTLRSMYEEADPPVAGVVHRWRFRSGQQEARAIAGSCRRLLADGLDPRQILVLLANVGAQLWPLERAFDDAGIPFERPRSHGFPDSDAGRFVLAACRIACEPEDYVAHRVLLGLLRGVGVHVCSSIADAAIEGNLNFRDLFYGVIPDGIFERRCHTALARASTLCAALSGWSGADALEARGQEIAGILTTAGIRNGPGLWAEYSASLPKGILLREVRDLLWADKDEQQVLLLEAVHERCGVPIPPQGVLPPRVRIMTMHGAKGLSGSVVFIPGLEAAILPGARRIRSVGKVLEAARLLYVSITRARAACILSWAHSRYVNGGVTRGSASQFVADAGGVFLLREGGLADDEVVGIGAALASMADA